MCYLIREQEKGTQFFVLVLSISRCPWTGCHGGWAREKLLFTSTVVLVESFTCSKCLNLPMLLLRLCDAVTSALQYCAWLWSPETCALRDMTESIVCTSYIYNTLPPPHTLYWRKKICCSVIDRDKCLHFRTMGV